MQRWFLIDDGPSAGAVNMAVDERLLSMAGDKGGEPFLRLYSFDPPAVTIGYHQDPLKILDVEKLRGDGIDLVRRITGGRALLHEAELTYCVAAPAGSPSFRGGLQETFIGISRAIVAALRAIGVKAEIAPGKPGVSPGAMTSPCLVSASRHEIVCRGRKIAGNAQRRTRTAFMQHGSILLAPGSERISRYLKGDWKGLEDLVTNAGAERGAAVTGEEMKDAMKASFAEACGAFFEPFAPGDRERKAIASLARSKSLEFSGVAGGRGTG